VEKIELSRSVPIRARRSKKHRMVVVDVRLKKRPGTERGAFLLLLPFWDF
jgi:hypothetical protein